MITVDKNSTDTTNKYTENNAKKIQSIAPVLKSFMSEVPIMQKPVHWFVVLINDLFSIRQ